VHFIRLVNSLGQINVLNESWIVDKEAEELVGEYVWATISTAEQPLRIYHQKAADVGRRLVVEHDYGIAEEVQELAPAYQLEGKLPTSTDC
jgi:hypothetical protein